jgi:hypothetical protein
VPVVAVMEIEGDKEGLALLVEMVEKAVMQMQEFRMPIL